MKVWGLLLSIMAFASTGLAEEAMTLKQCYDEAKRYSMTVAVSEEQIRQAQAHYSQVLGSILPKITALIREELQEPESFSGGSSSTTQFEDTFTRLSTPSVGVNMTQPLFHGFKEFQAFKIFRAEKAQKQFNLQNTERLLLQDIAIAFFTIAQTEKDIARIKLILKVFRDREVELQQRIKLGKSRPSEYALQETDTSLLEAELERRQKERLVAYQMMSFLTGLVPQPPIKLDDPLDEALRPLDDYISFAEGRPDYLAAKQGITMAQGEVKVRKGDLYPQADMEANVWAYRVGFLKEIQWDLTFNLAVPIFNWETFGNIKEAKTKLQQATMQAEQTRRSAVREIRESYDSFSGSRKVYSKFKKAAQMATNSYGLQLKDFALGLINYLDVLNAQRTLMEALRQRDTAEVATWLDWYQLQVKSGALP